jgi:hypothetical protein
MLSLENIMGVYVLDDTRLSQEELENVTHQVIKLYLYFDERKQACYLYHLYLLDAERELSIYEEGFFDYKSNNDFIRFEVVHQYELQIEFDKPDSEKYHKAYYHYNPAQRQDLSIHTDKGIYLENQGHFYLPIERDIYGRKSEVIVRELLILGAHYRDNWNTLLRP